MMNIITDSHLPLIDNTIAVTMISSSKTFLSWFLVAFVVALSVLLSAPQPELDWENEILPLALLPMATSTTDVDFPLTGLVVVITGATSGIGLELARMLTTKLGATVIGIGRSPSKLHKLKQEGILNQTFVADFSDLNEVAAASRRMIDTVPKIDVLVNNAGLYPPPSWEYRTTKQGYDWTFGVNYLSHVLLTEKLSPLLNQSDRPKVVQVTSISSFAVSGTDLSTSTTKTHPIASQPGGNTGFIVAKDVRAYANSKLAQLLHARALSRRYPKWRVVSACPQWVASEIVTKTGFAVVGYIFQKLAYPCHGYGINSILRAVLSNHGEESDFYTNTNIGCMALMDRLPRFCYDLVPIRDSMAWLMGMAILIYQRWIPAGGTATSSNSSYDTTLQDDLYQWSLSSVSQWL